MTPNSNASKWLKIIGGILLAIIAVIAWIYLSGFLFLAMAKLPFDQLSSTTLYDYWTHYSDDKEVVAWLQNAAFIGFIGVMVPVLFILKPKQRSLYGQAKWATLPEIRKAGLLGNLGIIVGQVRNQFLLYAGASHVLLSAKTRGGKGVGIVIPNCLNWSDSMVVLDVKKENWDITAGFRAKHGQQCFIFNPATRDYETHCWNPLYYISDNPDFAINDIQKIASMIFPDQDGADPIWSASCRSFFLGLVLYIRETEGLACNLSEVLNQATQGDDKRFIGIIEERQETETALSAECVSALNDYLNTSDNTRTSIRKTFTSRFELFQNPVIAAATSRNDFDFNDLRKKNISIYVAVTPDDLERLGPILNLFFQQLIDINTRELPEQNPELKKQVLLLMDEFAAIGKIPILSKGISYIAGYGLRMLPIIQSPAQLRDIYGDNQAETFMDNHALKIIFTPPSMKVAEEISKELGNTTVKSKSHSRQLSGKTNKSENQSDHKRELLLPQEVKELGMWEQIILLDNCKPIRCKKIISYKDKTFTERRDWPTPDIPKLIVKRRENAVIDFDMYKKTVEKPVTVENIDQMNSLSLDDFSYDFSSIDVPGDAPLSEQDVDNLVDQFFNEIEAA